MDNTPFDPIGTLQEVKKHRAMQRRQQYRKSKLDKFRAELVALKKAGASGQDIVTWLRMAHRVKIHRSSVDRYLSALPEMDDKKSPKPTPSEDLGREEE